MSNPYLADLSGPDLLGVFGALLYIAAYAAVACDLTHSRSPWFYLANLGAAAFVLVGLCVSFNLGSAINNAFFVAVSVLGILRHRKRQGDITAAAVALEEPRDLAAAPPRAA